MAVIAQWLSKKWEVSPQKVVALEGLTTSYKLKKDTNDDAEGKPPTNYRRLELQPLTFETFLSDTVGINVRDEIESWGALVGKSAPFLLGGKRFGPEKLVLDEVSASELLVDDFGRIRQAKLSMSFEEEAPEDSKSKPQNQQASAASSSAVNVGAKTADKAEKKPSAIAARWEAYNESK